MIDRIDLFHLPFYKKEAFTGSDRGLRFWIGKTDTREEGAEEEKLVLRVIIWPEPFALKHTPDEQKLTKDFPFSEEGLDEIYEWILEKGEAWSDSRNGKKEGITAFLFSSPNTFIQQKDISTVDFMLLFYYSFIDK